MTAHQKLTLFLWFAGNQAEEAARFYVETLPDARIVGSSAMATEFEVAGVRYVALNGNPGSPFTEATSLLINCDSQEEIDRLWDGLLAGGGTPSRCGWLKDRFGMSWQVVPRSLPSLLGKGKALQAMLTMTKLNLAELERAATEV